jgi:hypothetical protein
MATLGRAARPDQQAEAERHGGQDQVVASPQLLGDRPGEQVRLAGRVHPQHPLHRRGRGEGRHVDRDRGRLVVVAAQQPHRERHECDQGQQDQAPDQDGGVHPGDEADDPVVEQPQLADDPEAERVGGDGRELVPQRR